ncbi:MAG: glycine cleavage system protein GcvH [Candidatus Aminicenantes bacterium]|nr:glycine cleavage system protein GcvH [Candidatus Aminicenantes bacterium]
MALENLLFTKEHEWLRMDGDSADVGITEYAQHELGDVVYVELPALGREFKKGDPAANIESVKAVSDVFSPLSGTITAVNAKLSNNPELVNQEPYGDGFLFKMKLSHMDEIKELLDQKKYEEYLQGISGE